MTLHCKHGAEAKRQPAGSNFTGTSVPVDLKVHTNRMICLISFLFTVTVPFVVTKFIVTTAFSA